MNIEPGHYATVLKMIPGGEEEIFEGTVDEICAEFASGAIARPGAHFMRLDGVPNLVLGRELKSLVAAYKNVSSNE